MDVLNFLKWIPVKITKLNDNLLTYESRGTTTHVSFEVISTRNWDGLIKHEWDAYTVRSDVVDRLLTFHSLSTISPLK